MTWILYKISSCFLNKLETTALVLSRSCHNKNRVVVFYINHIVFLLSLYCPKFIKKNKVKQWKLSLDIECIFWYTYFYLVVFLGHQKMAKSWINLEIRNSSVSGNTSTETVTYIFLGKLLMSGLRSVSIYHWKNKLL